MTLHAEFVSLELPRFSCQRKNASNNNNLQFCMYSKQLWHFCLTRNRREKKHEFEKKKRIINQTEQVFRSGDFIKTEVKKILASTTKHSEMQEMLLRKNIDGHTIDGQHKYAPNSRSGIINRTNGESTRSSQNIIMKQLFVLTMLLFMFKEATGLAGE